MQAIATREVVTGNASQSLRFDRAELEIKAQLDAGSMTIHIMKSGACVHKLTIGDAETPLEHGWIADMFAREDHIELNSIVREADDYVSGLNINQG